MRATVQLIRGHENTLFQRGVDEPSDAIVSWEPDESDEHKEHESLNPGCAKCVTGTGDWKLVDLAATDVPDPDHPTDQPADPAKPEG